MNTRTVADRAAEPHKPTTVTKDAVVPDMSAFATRASQDLNGGQGIVCSS